MPWPQNYEPLDGIISSALVASIPVVLLLVLALVFAGAVLYARTKPRSRRESRSLVRRLLRDTIDELAQARETLLRLDAYTGESSHGATKSVYAHDPDGNEFVVRTA